MIDFVFDLCYNLGVIKAIVFDFAGVVAPGLIKQWVQKKFAPDDIRKKRILEMADEASKKWDIEDITVNDFFETLTSVTGLSHTLILKELYEDSVFFPEVVAIIKKLKPQYKIILFSNNYAFNLYKILDRHDLRLLFDEIIISSEHKLIKPDHAFFRVMLNIAHVKKHEAVFIDDTAENVKQANIFGITSFVYTTAKRLEQDLQMTGIRI